jgi:C1A family cysteine protease
MTRNSRKPLVEKYLMRMHSFCLILLIAAVFLLSGSSVSQVWAAEELQAAPLNPAFVNHLQKMAIQTGLSSQPMTTSDGHGLGHIPSPVRIPAPAVSSMANAPTALPAKFDLRTSTPIGVTSVKDQAMCGSCWAFGTMSSLESHLKYKNNWTADYSEADLNEYHGFDYGVCMGGDYIMATAYMARWGGPVAEADAPYPYWFTETGGASQGAAEVTALEGATPGVSPRIHVQNVYFLPQSSKPLSAADIARLKTAIQTNGAVGIYVYWDNTYYNSTTHSFYASAGGASTNHAIAAVGWDDSYPKTNFKSPQPAGNGAFIVKNSWGTSWGESGYFYLSYYDMDVELAAQFYSSSPVTNYTHIYQYDPLGLVNNYGYSSGTKTMAWYSNIFMASANASKITGVSTYTLVPNATYTIYVYSNVTPGQPRSGSLAGTKTGTLPKPGYNTIPLTASAVTANAPFSVVMQINTPNYNYPIPIEYAESGYSTAASACPGQSFVSHDGTSWTDAGTSSPNYNVCLKAFAIK